VEENGRQSWTLIAIAALGLVLGVVALVIAFDAKNTSEDAVSKESVEKVSIRLSNLASQLGVAEKSLDSEERAVEGTATREATRDARATRNAAASLSKRISRLEKETASLSVEAKEAKGLAKRVGSLETELETANSRITALNQRVTKLSQRVSSVAGDGGQTAG